MGIPDAQMQPCKVLSRWRIKWLLMAFQTCQLQLQVTQNLKYLLDSSKVKMVLLAFTHKEPDCLSVLFVSELLGVT